MPPGIPKLNMAASVAPLMAAACEMLMAELTIKAATKAEFEKRKTVQRRDILAAIQMSENFDFLKDTVYESEDDEEGNEGEPLVGIFVADDMLK